MRGLAPRFSRDESGATAIEYAFIALFIFLAIVASVRLLGPSLVAVFTGANAGSKLAKANELGEDILNALEIKLPTKTLFDRLKPFDLQSFDLRKIFPNFSGLNLADLFDGLKLPQSANDNVKITHGVDPQSRRGWAQIDVDIPFGDPVTLFSIASLAMSVKSGRCWMRKRGL